MSTIARRGRWLVLALSLAFAAPAPSTAQEMTVIDPNAPAEGEGNPLWGYLACGFACVAIIFAISISSRR